MGNKRNLKRLINGICGSLFTETIAASLYGDNTNKEEIDALLTSIVLLRSEYVSRISHVEPGMSAKIYFTDLRKKFDAETNEIIDQTSNLV